MHISEGVLPGPVLAGGAALTCLGLSASVRKLEPERIPRIALLSSAFFVGSLIHLPLGGTSVHLVLIGLIGLILGTAAIPAIFVALTLQALLFQFGGFTALGVNTTIMALPAVLVHFVFRRWIKGSSGKKAWLAGFGAGSLALALAALLLSAAIASSGQAFKEVAALAWLSYMPLMFIEGILTAFSVAFLRKVKPAILLLLILFVAGPAGAHKVSIFAYEEGGTIHTESYFVDGTPCNKCEVTAHGSDGSVLAEGLTDQEGLFGFPAPEQGDVRIVLDAGLGHRNETTLTRSRSSDEGTESRPSSSSPPAAGDLPDEEAVRAIVREETSSLRDSLNELQRETEKPALKEVLAGLGYILGLAGAYLWGANRRGHRAS